MDSYVPADCLPGMLDGWCGPQEVNLGDDDFPDWRSCHSGGGRVDTRRPEVRDHLSRVLAAVLGVLVGATAPNWSFRHGFWFLSGDGHTEAFTAEPTMYPPRCPHVPSLADIPLDSPDRDSLALAAVFRWVGEEVRAGRIQDRRSKT